MAFQKLHMGDSFRHLTFECSLFLPLHDERKMSLRIIEVTKFQLRRQNEKGSFLRDRIKNGQTYRKDPGQDSGKSGDSGSVINFFTSTLHPS